MSNSEAKFILGAYRPGGRDASDPAFADALKQAQTDPQVGEWFARSRAYDAAVAAKLGSVQPPASLRDALIAGARMGRPKPSFLRSPRMLALAAALVVGLGLGVVVRHQQAGAASEAFASFAMDDMLHGHHGGHGAETGQLTSWLADSGNPLTAGIPVNMEKLESTGCRTLRFAGHDVVEVCFSRQGEEYHLYVARVGDAQAKAHGPSYVSGAGATVAEWADGRFAYALATAAGESALRRLL